MFRIECFCDDKNLARVMHGLSGLVLDLKAVPVVNAAMRNGKLTAETNGKLPDMFVEYLKKHKLTEVTPKQIGDFTEAAGRSRKSYSNVLADLRKAGVLRKAGGKGNKIVYRVVMR